MALGPSADSTSGAANSYTENPLLNSLAQFNASNLRPGTLLSWNGREWEILDFELASLFDVDVSDVEDGDLLVYDEYSGKWIAEAPPEVEDPASVPAEDPGAAITTIGSNEEGSETASSDTWSAGGDNGLAEWYLSRVVYKEDGDMKIYAFFRKRTYDKYGRLYSVSGETRVEIDATVTA